MNPFELMTTLLAPHLCLVCKKESQPLCSHCIKNCLEAPTSACYRCRKPTADFATCSECSHHSPISYAWAGAAYSGVAKELVARLKFERVKAAAIVIADYLHAFLPPLSTDTTIVPVPTANRRIRTRGYDQAELIARHLAHRRGLRCRNLLRRLGATRQVGSGREQRFSQLQDAFTAKTPRGQPLLLIDDVSTTGATLEAAANVLTQAGAGRINAAVFAR